MTGLADPIVGCGATSTGAFFGENGIEYSIEFPDIESLSTTNLLRLMTSLPPLTSIARHGHGCMTFLFPAAPCYVVLTGRNQYTKATVF